MVAPIGTPFAYEQINRKRHRFRRDDKRTKGRKTKVQGTHPETFAVIDVAGMRG
ncbi:hypothetical protein [Acidisoma sp. 7E03]